MGRFGAVVGGAGVGRNVVGATAVGAAGWKEEIDPTADGLDRGNAALPDAPTWLSNVSMRIRKAVRGAWDWTNALTDAS